MKLKKKIEKKNLMKLRATEISAIFFHIFKEIWKKNQKFEKKIRNLKKN